MKKLRISVDVSVPEGLLEQSRVVAAVEPVFNEFLSSLNKLGHGIKSDIQLVGEREKKGAEVPAAAAPTENAEAVQPAGQEATQSTSRRRAAA